MSARRVYVCATPADLPPAAEGPWQPVVIDVLRATSTIVTALAAGAAAVLPVATPEEALRGRDADPAPALAAGERQRVRLPGFDLGNSPREFTSEAVGGRRIHFTTTNGTRAILATAPFGEVLCASFLNLSACVRALCANGRDALVVCSGTDAHLSEDDLGVAGGLAAALLDEGECEANYMALAARDLFEANRDDLPGFLSRTEYGRLLAAAGFEADIVACSRLDAFRLVPRFHDGAVTTSQA